MSGKKSRQTALYPRVRAGRECSHSGAVTAVARSGAGSKERRGREVVEFTERFVHFPGRLEPGAAGRAPAAQTRQGQSPESESA